MATNSKEYTNKYRKEHLEKRREQERNYGNSSLVVRERRKKYRKDWMKRNRNRWNFYGKSWRQRRRGANGKHTLKEWEILKAQYNWICPSCERQEPEIILTEDHIIPISLGGSNNIENIQPLCRSCNSKKGIKIELFQRS